MAAFQGVDMYLHDLDRPLLEVDLIIAKCEEVNPMSLLTITTGELNIDIRWTCKTSFLNSRLTKNRAWSSCSVIVGLAALHVLKIDFLA